MKYPQLVSARAVSAISDWLVTQLEQLGVDASLVYSRLLLSLLHTPLQINALDLAEISDIKIGNSVRKGTNRRFSAADTEAIKRVAAIDSLLEAVSSDHQLSQIESLIDELSQKLRDIENQNHLDDSVFIQNDDNLETMKQTASHEDPAKRYYSAFPALSKELTGSSVEPLINIDIKSLAWPSTGASIIANSKLSSNSSVISSSISGIKKKPRRRRVNATMASASGPNGSNKPSATYGRVNSHSNRGHSASMQQRKTSSIWDTDFDGAWEMGRDLIREFVMKQNNRNRSISESDACKFVELQDVRRNNAGNKRANKTEMAADAGGLAKGVCNIMEQDDNLMQVAAAATTSIFNKNVDNERQPSINMNATDSGTFSTTSTITDTSILMLGNLIRPEGYATPDTLSSLHDPAVSSVPRRLYEREVSNESINANNDNCFASKRDPPNPLAAFEAKFNRNVEALWDDSKEDANTPVINNLAAQPQPLPTNVESFWFNYYKHHYNSDDQIEAPAGLSLMYPNTGQDKVPISEVNVMNSLPNISLSNSSAARNSTLSKMYESTGQPTGGGMNLTSSIWSDNVANNESDLSFYANAAALWDKTGADKILEQSYKLNFVNNEANRLIGSDEYSGIPIGPAETATSAYDKSNFSKWSDCTFETPFIPSIGSESSANSLQSNADKIRNNMFDNSYFSDFKSMPGVQPFTAEGALSTNSNRPHLTAQRNAASSIQVIDNTPAHVKVTLSNHSSSSGFEEVLPSHSFSKPAERYNPPSKEKFSPVDQNAEEENLLTSERTHFRPIKQTYVDGYTFEISNELEDVKYHRSASGTLYLDTEVYREYYLYEEDIGDNSGRIANSGKRNGEVFESENTSFVLKYCVKQNEKGCQTDELPSQQIAPVVSNASNVNTMRINGSGSSSIGSDVDMENDMVCFNNVGAHRSQAVNEKSLEDVMDGSYLMNIDGWTLAENRKRCHNNNNTHALWEHCAACTNDVVSLPANRLLKDELSADGDEIMSDLKYMQNLYIGSDWEDEDCEEDEDYDGLLQPLELSAPTSFGIVDDDDDGYNDEQTNHIYSNVSKLISDLLQPERAQTLVQAISDKVKGVGFGGTSLEAKGPSTSYASDISSTSQALSTAGHTPFAQGFNRIVSRNDNDLVYDGANNNNNNNHVNYFGDLWSNNNNNHNANNSWRKEASSRTSTDNENIWSNYVPPGDTAISNKVEEIKPSSSLLSMSSFSTKQADYWEHANLVNLWSRQSSGENNTTESGPAVGQTKGMKQGAFGMPLAPEKNATDQPSTSNSINDQPPQSYSISNDDQQALQRFIDLANQQSNTNDHDPPVQQDPNGLNVSTANQRRTDRKRRHSATSQNLLDQFNYALATYSTDRRKLSAANHTDQDDDVDNDDDCAIIDVSATTAIITCKYWATDSLYLASALAMHGRDTTIHSHHLPQNVNGTMAMHPTTILKHVAEMVARPLTR